VVEEEAELTSSPIINIFNKTGIKSPHQTQDRTASRQHIYKVSKSILLVRLRRSFSVQRETMRKQSENFIASKRRKAVFSLVWLSKRNTGNQKRT
jgi:hypothetical protein